jgi:hypothetical protein
LNAFVFVFAMVSAGVYLTGLRRAIPVILQRRQVRQFRKELVEVDLVVLAWRHTLCDGLSHDVAGMLPHVLRPRRPPSPRARWPRRADRQI